MSDIDALAVGLVVWRPGAGRPVPVAPVQVAGRLRIHRKPAERIGS